MLRVPSEAILRASAARRTLPHSINNFCTIIITRVVGRRIDITSEHKEFSALPFQPLSLTVPEPCRPSQVAKVVTASLHRNITPIQRAAWLDHHPGMKRVGAELGQRIRHLRDSRGLTQSDLANRTHKSVETISNFERGKTIPSVRTLAQLADVLEDGIEAFFQAERIARPPDNNFAARLRLLSRSEILLVSDFIDMLRNRSREKQHKRR